MKKLILGSALALSICSIAAYSEEMTAFVSESHCAAKHSAPSAAATKCINACLKGGSEPVLVKDGKVYKLDSDSAEKAKAYAGDNVKVDGTVNGDTMTISSIEKAE